MVTRTRTWLSMTIAVAISACTTIENATRDIEDEKRSSPNDYAGYSQAIYDGHDLSSFYIPMRDGTRLAVDLIRPTLNGEPASASLPVVWMHTPYNRREFRGRPTAEFYPGYALKLVPHGYNVAVVDFRGVFASFGHNIGYNRGEWLDEAKWDAYDITEWLADQPWSNGRVGMWGCSATGGSQMQALTTRPPSLKAVVPMSAEYDAYAFAVLGGAAPPKPIAPPNTPEGVDMVAMRDKIAVAVDGPDGGAELTDAIASHANNVDSVGLVPFRDSISPTTGSAWWNVSSPHTYADALGDIDIGVLSVANWDEAGTRHGPFITFNNLPQETTKLLVGPATHCDWSTVKDDTGFDLVTEELRFYDHWLKGVDNQVMTEPAVTYFTYNAPSDEAWRQSETWPLVEEQRTGYYLSAERSLSPDIPPTSDALPQLITAPGRSDVVSVATPDQGLILETTSLQADLEITGHPVVDLWIQTHAPDVDVTAFLLDVSPDGTTRTHQMLGRLRASHRKLSNAPYDNLDLPWHSFAQADSSPLPTNEPVRLVFDMLPMSYIFPKGHKLRLQLSFTDPNGGEGGETVTVLTGGEHASHVVLPIIPDE